MENNFEEKKKDIDLSNIDHDSQTYDRRKLELDYKYECKRETEESFCTKEIELANNYEDEYVRQSKIIAIQNDLKARLARLDREYSEELSKIEENSEKKIGRPLYEKWMYTGPIKKYDRILGAFEYYIKLDDNDKLTVYYDSKYSQLVNEIPYIENEWTTMPSTSGKSQLVV